MRFPTVTGTFLSKQSSREFGTELQIKCNRYVILGQSLYENLANWEECLPLLQKFEEVLYGTNIITRIEQVSPDLQSFFTVVFILKKKSHQICLKISIFG